VSTQAPHLSARRVSRVVTEALVASGGGGGGASEVERAAAVVDAHRSEVIEGMLWPQGGGEADVTAGDEATRDSLILSTNVSKLHPLRGRLPRRLVADRRGFRTYDALSDVLTNEWGWGDLKSVHLSATNAAAFDIEVPRGVHGGRKRTHFNAMRFVCEDADVCEKVVAALARFHHTDGMDATRTRLASNMG
jgi:hypothetical protein